MPDVVSVNRSAHIRGPIQARNFDSVAGSTEHLEQVLLHCAERILQDGPAGAHALTWSDLNALPSR